MKLETHRFSFVQESEKPDAYGTVEIEVATNGEVLNVKVEGNVKIWDLSEAAKRASGYRLA